MQYAKYGLAALVVAFFFALGWYAHPSSPLVTVADEHKVQETVAASKAEVAQTEVTKTTTVEERKPNGTVKKTKTVEVAKAANRTEVQAVRATEAVAVLHKDSPSMVAPPPTPAANWSVGAEWQVQRLDTYRPVAAELGYRVGGPVWVTGSWNWQTHSALVGARVEF